MGEWPGIKGETPDPMRFRWPEELQTWQETPQEPATPALSIVAVLVRAGALLAALAALLWALAG